MVETPAWFSWSRSDPQIARAIFLYVSPEYRGLRVGKVIYDFLYPLLRTKGCVVTEGHIAATNESSLKVHARSGWQLEKCREGHYYCIKQL